MWFTLTPTNRILVRAGLEAFCGVPFIGLTELLLSCEIDGGNITSEDIGYLVGPKINAAGRLGKSKTAVELLTTSEPKKARSLAQVLTELNEQRKRISSENLEIALSSMSISLIQQNKSIIVKGELHQGVAGIVASRLVDMFGLPAIVFAKKSDGAGGDSFRWFSAIHYRHQYCRVISRLFTMDREVWWP